jgi:hypothetical protein
MREDFEDLLKSAQATIKRELKWVVANPLPFAEIAWPHVNSAYKLSAGLKISH